MRQLLPRSCLLLHAAAEKTLDGQIGSLNAELAACCDDIKPPGLFPRLGTLTLWRSTQGVRALCGCRLVKGRTPCVKGECHPTPHLLQRTRASTHPRFSCSTHIPLNPSAYNWLWMRWALADKRCQTRQSLTYRMVWPSWSDRLLVSALSAFSSCIACAGAAT